jgi:outer membrane protein TolC
MHVELGLREMDIRRSQEALAIASARLTQLLRLEPCVQLQPLEPTVLPLCVIPKDCQCADLVAQALYTRPELAQNRYLVGEAVQRLRRERFAPLVPSVLLGMSYGEFSGGRGSDFGAFRDRFDFDATAFWELRNLGFGETAARDSANSRLRQSQIQELAALDQVAREVSEAYTQVQLREQQVATARSLVQFATDSFEHNSVRIQRGQGLPIEVLQSIQALLQVRREYLRSITDYNAAQFTLHRALGWPVQHLELTAPPSHLP